MSENLHPTALDFERGIYALVGEGAAATIAPSAAVGCEYTDALTGDFWKMHTSGWSQIGTAASSGSADWSNIANRPTTRDGYGLTDVSTTAQTATLLAAKANAASTLGGYGITDAYTAAVSDARYAFAGGAIYPSQFQSGYVDVGFSFRNNASQPSQFGTMQGNSTFTGSALWIREGGYAGGPGTRPSLGFHWSGVVASQIIMDPAGDFQFQNNPGNAYQSVRAKDYYASRGDNTGAYYFGNGGPQYLYFNGSYYVLNGGGLAVTADISSRGLVVPTMQWGTTAPSGTPVNGDAYIQYSQ